VSRDLGVVRGERSGVLVGRQRQDDATMSLHLAALAVPLALLGTWTLRHFVRDHPVRPADG
jgi:hypothetical protein